MIGRFLSKVVKIATCPIDIAEAVVDTITGGDGSKSSRARMKADLPCPSNARDAICNALKDIDDD